MSLFHAAATPGSEDPARVPLFVPPEGTSPNFDGGPNLEPVVLATGLVFIPFGMILIGIRLAMSLKYSRKLHLDDWEVFGVAYWIVLYQFQVRPGLFKHTWDVPIVAITYHVFKTHFAAEILNMTAHAFIKFSIPVFFIRLFGSLKWVRRTCYFLIGAVVIFSIAPLISMLVVCMPIDRHNWDLAFTATCATSAGPQTIPLGVFAVAFDVVVVVIPIFITSKLDIDRVKKRNIIIVFLISLLVVVASATGLAYMIIVREGTDPLWNDGIAAITSYMEIFGTAIVSCAPGLRSFWLTMSDKMRRRPGLPSKRQNPEELEITLVSEGPGFPRQVPSAYKQENRSYNKHPGFLRFTPGVEDQLTPLSPLRASPIPLPHHSRGERGSSLKGDGYWGRTTTYQGRQ
ncbi:hypothetical protein F5Y11DRAFT_350345 [Daldinia sp. FL1419]|nr:hypothetical protein F5Y11DRAFT_350345 [Daldinia sp. FL1419]